MPVKSVRPVQLLALVLAGVVACFLIPISMRETTSAHVYSQSDVPPSQAAIVLGASVVKGAPSPVLAARADTAIALYLTGKVKKILVTGDNGALSHDEVTPVRKYLLDAGIHAGDIFLDHAGFDTYSSMFRAHEVFEASSVVIVTQDFHLPRALWIARRLGLDAVGVASSGSGSGSVRDYAREVPASLKALFDVVMRREPKYLGPTIPLTGDGEATWY
ncbi:MAG: YdcF family protein [Patescibacteria group bacterium]|nr:YdcF family protein [Patescibacteria group bacterium]